MWECTGSPTERLSSSSIRATRKRWRRSKRRGAVLCGDVDTTRVAPIAGRITPVPGGVGPLTIAMLMANTARAAEQRRGPVVSPGPCTVGLTGGLASGKSTVAEGLERLGAEVFDCDAYVHELYRPGGAGAWMSPICLGTRCSTPRAGSTATRLAEVVFGCAAAGETRRRDTSSGPERRRGVAAAPSDQGRSPWSKRRCWSKPARGGTTISSPSSGVIAGAAARAGGRSRGCRGSGPRPARRTDAHDRETGSGAGRHRQRRQPRRARCRGPTCMARDRHALQAAVTKGMTAYSQTSYSLPSQMLRGAMASVVRWFAET